MSDEIYLHWFRQRVVTSVGKVNVNFYVNAVLRDRMCRPATLLPFHLGSSELIHVFHCIHETTQRCFPCAPPGQI